MIIFMIFFFFLVIVVFDMDSFLLLFIYLLFSYYLGRVKLAFEDFEILNSNNFEILN